MQPLLSMARESDAPICLSVYAPYVRQTAITFEYEVPSAGEFARRIRAVREQGDPWLLLTMGDALIGYAYAAPFHARAAYQWGRECSIYLAGEFRGRGYGSALYRALLSLLARQGYQTAYGVITLPGEASVALHQSLGFQKEGVHHAAGYKNGAWHDVLLMAKPLGAYAAPPAPVRPCPSELSMALDSIASAASHD